MFGGTALYLWLRERRRDFAWRNDVAAMGSVEHERQIEHDKRQEYERDALQKSLQADLESLLVKQQVLFRQESERYEKKSLDIEDARVGSGGYIVVEMPEKDRSFFTIS